MLRKALAKKPDARYRNCQEFVEALEKACGASKGWRLMPRGGMLNEPTMADVKKPALAAPAPILLPPPRRKVRALGASGTTEVRKKSGFPAFLLAVLMAAGLLALIGWQASPWLTPGRQPAGDGEAKTAARQEPAATAPAPVNVPAPAPQLAPEDAKPSPVGTAAGNSANKPADRPAPAPLPPINPQPEVVKPASNQPGIPAPRPDRREGPPRTGAPQAVTFLSSPAGATATVDGNRSMSCATPCSLSLPTGRHVVTITLAGYQLERGEFAVGAGPVELSPVQLRLASGTLMLSSVPPGASISVNGRRIDLLTPAQLTLSLGVYSITIEKGGLQATEKVEITSGITTRRIILGQ